MGEEFKVFEIDDDFDPLESLDADEGEKDGQSDYLIPTEEPDKAAPRVPVVQMSAKERIEQLFVGMPGQKPRLLRAIDICSNPKTIDELDAELSAAFPGDTSVYGAGRVALLLAEAGGLEELASAADAISETDDFQGNACEAAGEEPATGSSEDGYLRIEPEPASRYQATADGLALVREYVGTQAIIRLIEEEKVYRPIYDQVLSLVSQEGGCSAKALDAAVNGNPLLQDPKRFVGYFVRKLEGVDALRWKDAWVATEAGRALVESEYFND